MKFDWRMVNCKAAFLLILGCNALAVAVHWRRSASPLARLAAQPSPKIDPLWKAPSPDRTWPWPGVAAKSLGAGVTRWEKSAEDGTDLQLIRFDFAVNPRLRFEVYDQDQDCPHPWSDHVKFSALGLAQAAAHLDGVGHGRVVAATNGLYFGASAYGQADFAYHVAPVVVAGFAHFGGRANARWTFGVKYVGGKPVFDALHTADVATLARHFDYAAGGAQVLVWDGVRAASPAEQKGKESAFEAMRTSRVAWGWSRDNRLLYLLFVKEPDEEKISLLAAKHHTFLPGGWMLSDVRELLATLGVWRAFNSDAGDMAQMLLRRADGTYDMVPPTVSGPARHLTLPPTASGAPDSSLAPHHGSLMYWYVSEVQ